VILAELARCPRCKGDVVALEGERGLRCAPCKLDLVAAAEGVLDLAPEIPPLDTASGAGRYDREAFLYDLPFKVFSRAFFSADHARFRAMSAEVGAAARVLDLPVGTGLFLPPPGPATRIVVGADLSTAMLARARARALASSDGASRAVFVRASAHGLPFKDGSFDAILCLNGLHVFPDPAAAARELARVVAPGGTAHIATLVAPRSLRGKLGARFIAGCGFFRPPLEEESMRALLGAAGLAFEAERHGEELYVKARRS
jgi:SAM-dependent methyltransferase